MLVQLNVEFVKKVLKLGLIIFMKEQMYIVHGWMLLMNKTSKKIQKKTEKDKKKMLNNKVNIRKMIKVRLTKRKYVIKK